MQRRFGLFQTDGAGPLVTTDDLDEIAVALLDESSGNLVVKIYQKSRWRPLSVREEGLLFALIEKKEGRSIVN